LYLNVFAPLADRSSNSTPLPVLVFIPGGNFQFLDASAPIYESERFVNTTNVVLVLLQYRLGNTKQTKKWNELFYLCTFKIGILGFFATGKGPNDIKGNFGLQDQRLALNWVKENINAFGGDPNEVRLSSQRKILFFSYMTIFENR